MQDKDKMGVIAGVIIVFGVLVGFWALMKMLTLLLPILGVVAIVGGLIWLKNRG